MKQYLTIIALMTCITYTRCNIFDDIVLGWNIHMNTTKQIFQNVVNFGKKAIHGKPKQQWTRIQPDTPDKIAYTIHDVAEMFTTKVETAFNNVKTGTLNMYNGVRGFFEPKNEACSYLSCKNEVTESLSKKRNSTEKKDFRTQKVKEIIPKSPNLQDNNLEDYFLKRSAYLQDVDIPLPPLLRPSLAPASSPAPIPMENFRMKNKLYTINKKVDDFLMQESSQSANDVWGRSTMGRFIESHENLYQHTPSAPIQKVDTSSLQSNLNSNYDIVHSSVQNNPITKDDEVDDYLWQITYPFQTDKVVDFSLQTTQHNKNSITNVISDTTQPTEKVESSLLQRNLISINDIVYPTLQNTSIQNVMDDDYAFQIMIRSHTDKSKEDSSSQIESSNSKTNLKRHFTMQRSDKAQNQLYKTFNPKTDKVVNEKSKDNGMLQATDQKDTVTLKSQFRNGAVVVVNLINDTNVLEDVNKQFKRNMGTYEKRGRNTHVPTYDVNYLIPNKATPSNNLNNKMTVTAKKRRQIFISLFGVEI